MDLKRFLHIGDSNAWQHYYVYNVFPPKEVTPRFVMIHWNSTTTLAKISTESVRFAQRIAKLRKSEFKKSVVYMFHAVPKDVVLSAFEELTSEGWTFQCIFLNFDQKRQYFLTFY